MSNILNILQALCKPYFLQMYCLNHYVRHKELSHNVAWKCCDNIYGHIEILYSCTQIMNNTICTHIEVFQNKFFLYSLHHDYKNFVMLLESTARC